MRGALDRTPLTRIEKQAVMAFTEALTREFGARIAEVDMHGVDEGTFRDNRDIQVLVLTNREDGELEDRAMDMVLDVLLETGIYLTVRTFAKARFQAFKRARIPAIQKMDEERLTLWKAA